MLLPFREYSDFGPTPYEQLQAKEGIPIVKGNVVSDVTTLELGRWERMGALGCYLNLSHQQLTDAYVCEIPPSGETLPQRHRRVAGGRRQGDFRVGPRGHVRGSSEFFLPAFQRLPRRTGSSIRRDQ